MADNERLEEGEEQGNDEDSPLEKHRKAVKEKNKHHFSLVRSNDNFSFFFG